MMRLAGIVAVAVGALMLAACGERPQVVRYKQGTYQGKPDTPPYDAQFKGNRGDWENALATRNQAQNEYKKVQ